MKNYVFRNYTIEQFFEKNFIFSGYGDVSIPRENYNEYIVFYQVNPGGTPEKQLLEISEIKSKIDYLVAGLPSDKRIIIFSLKNYYNRDWEQKNNVLSHAIWEFNDSYLSGLEMEKGVKIIRIDSFFENDTAVEPIDWKYFFMSQVPINPKLARNFKNWFKIQSNALTLQRKKCIVLDCDNTLWGGVLGEEGVHGVQLGEDFPGICFLRFQELLAEASLKGIVLAISSKNNEQDVCELWREHPKHILNENYIAAYRINWEDKVSNIRSIAEELNIGLDSIIFMDDNPVERELVKNFLPEVIVPDFPSQPYDLVNFFWEIYNEYFITYRLSKEDLRKTEQYKENNARTRDSKLFAELDDYLASLEMEISVFNSSDSNISRISQMTQKTNQFNLTTKRYTEENIRDYVRSGALVFCCGIKDKFGDNGITIAGIFIPLSNTEIEIDSYLLSCRILGRNIETATLQYLLNFFKQKGIISVRAKYIPTSKNILAADFLDKAGFSCIEIKSGVKYYHLDLRVPFVIKQFYKITSYGGKDQADNG